MAEILYPDGTSKEVHQANGDHFEIEELMHQMNQPRMAHVLPTEGEEGDDPP